MDRIVVVGSGNVAWHLTRALSRADNCQLVQLMARQSSRAEELASSVGLILSTFDQELLEADYYIFALRDDVVEEQIRALTPHFASGSIVCHTSASLPLIKCERDDVASSRFYPLQSFTSGVEVDFNKITIFVESKCGKSSKNLVALSCKIASRGVEVASDELSVIHLAATFANNFTNRMYHHASEILHDKGMTLELLYPLIEEGVRKIITTDARPCELQTGAAVRGDREIINRHRARLSGARLELYDTITKDILDDKF